MNDNFMNSVYLAGAFLTLFGVSELLFHFFKWKAELTRKIVHVFTGLLSLSFPILLDNHWFVLGLCGSFLVILIASLKLDWLPSINKVDRITRGSLLYPVIVYSCFLIQDYFDSLIFYYIPILILAVCDPIAELVGKNIPRGKYKTFGHTKTLSGSFGFCLTAVLISSILLIEIESIASMNALIIGLTIGVLTSIVEGFSHKGYDNLSIPSTVVVVLIFFFNNGFI